MILAIAEPTRECGFRAFSTPLEFSALWIVEKTRRLSLSFPQIPNDAARFALFLGKTLDSLGKTALEAVDKFKRDCGISGGY